MTLQLHIDSRHLSPYAMSACVAAWEKALPIELVRVDLSAGEQNREAYAAASLTQRVPMLVQDGFALTESTAIAEYLDECFPTVPIYPREPRARARARQVQAWLRSDLLSIRQERSTEVVFLGAAVAPLSAMAQEAARKLFHVAGSLLGDGEGPLFGEWCLADTDLAVMLQRLVQGGDPVPENLRRYAQRQWERPTVRRWCELARGAAHA